MVFIRTIENSNILIALATAAAYIVASQAVGEFYPFSRTDMFSAQGEHSARLLVLDARGGAHELEDTAAWTCKEPLDFRARAQRSCPLGAHAERDVKAIGTLRSRIGTSKLAEPVQLVRRVYSAAAPSAPLTERDCVLATCTASLEPQ